MGCVGCEWKDKKCSECFWTAPELHEKKRPNSAKPYCSNCIHEDEDFDGEHCKDCKHNKPDWSKYKRGEGA